MPTTGENAETAADRIDAIRAFYESHPYPAPITTLEQRLDRYRDPQRRRAQSLLLWPLEKPRPDRSILVAGCGTSQAARHALMEPDARSPRSTSAKRACATPAIFNQARHTKFAAPPACDRADRGAWRDLRSDRLHRRASSSERSGRGPSLTARCPSRDGAMHIMVYAPYGRAGIA